MVEARRPGSGTGQKFSRVEMSDFNIVEYGTAAVVTCAGAYEGAHGTFTLKFMRVWLKREGNWQIIAAATLA